MKQRPENLSAAGGDPEATLVTPRFDEAEASRANPVVPLAEADRHAPYGHPRSSARRGIPRSWTPALLAVVLLASVAAGGIIASKVFTRAQPEPAAAELPAAVAPAQAEEAPAHTEQPAAEVEAPREVADTNPEPRAPRVTRERRDEEDAPVPVRVEPARVDAEDLEDKGRRGKGRKKQRARADDDDGEKEIRQAIKRAAKDKAPRLVDVLVTPRP